MTRKPMTFKPGIVLATGETVCYVGKPRKQLCMHEGGGTYYILLVTLGFTGPDGVTRLGRFAQRTMDTIVPGRLPSYRPVPLSDPQEWPKFPVVDPNGMGGDRT